jgi:hypothetical protein
MFRKINRSARIARLLESFSGGLAKRRGLPIVIGIGLIIVAFIARIAWLAAPAPHWEVIWTITLHVGLLSALIGIVLLEPLGR